MKVVIANDCQTCGGEHFGCALVMEAYREQCARVGIEILAEVPWNVRSLDEYPKACDKADLIIVNGEGSIHHGCRGELLDIAERWPAVLINCVYDTNPHAWGEKLKKFKYIATRESRSAEIIRGASGRECDIVPEIAYTSQQLVKWKPTGPPTADIGVTDRVGWRDAPIHPFMRPRDFFAAVSNYRRIATGRFHGIMVCATLEIPFSAFPSNTHKNQGVMEDMGVRHLYFETVERAKERAPFAFDLCIRAYVREAYGRVNKMFEGLWGLR